MGKGQVFTFLWQTQKSFYARLNERIIVMCRILNVAHSMWKEMKIL
jgi:hypothetical protein